MGQSADSTDAWLTKRDVQVWPGAVCQVGRLRLLQTQRADFEPHAEGLNPLDGARGGSGCWLSRAYSA